MAANSYPSVQRRILFVFLDGVGLGDDDASNPFTHAALPGFRRMLDGRLPLLRNTPYHGTRASLVALDATLGVPGKPQSGTGQATLLTGRNAAQLHGRHFGPWVPAAIRPMLRDENILSRAKRAGLDVAFANAYPRQLLEPVTTGRASQFLRAGPPIAAMGADVFNRHAEELLRGDAVASEILNEGWREQLGHTELPVISATVAAANLVTITARHHLTFFAHYATDTIGHSGDLQQAIAALERVDEFMGALHDALPEETLMVVASDHGNIEDIRGDHTRNPSLGIVRGSGHATIARRMSSLLDVTPVLLDVLGVSD